MHRHLLILTVAGLVVLMVGRSPAAESGPPSEDEQTLQAAGVGTDGPALLEFFRRRSTPDADQGKIQDLIHKLGDRSAQVRNKAEVDLVAVGQPAIPLLRQAVEGHDIAVAGRAKTCLRKIGTVPEDMVPAAAARVLALRQPEKTAEVLLNYLTTVSDEDLSQEVQSALAAVAFRDGRLDPVLGKALGDKNPGRRAAAAVALCRGAGERAVPEVAPLLHDPEVSVRRRVAPALADLRDGDAVPVLIALLGELPEAQAAEVDSFLYNLAGDLAPHCFHGSESSGREECRAIWSQWWRQTDGSALVTKFRQATPSERDRARMKSLLKELGNDDFAVREQASRDLTAMGMVAVPLLRQAMKDPDVEIAQRAENCLKRIVPDPAKVVSPGEVLMDESGHPVAGVPKPGNVLPAGAARVVALKKPPGAAEALLAYLPMADSDQRMEEVRDALTALAFHDGGPDRTLLQALQDPAASRRGAAAVALSRAARTELPEVHPLLEDRDPGVRLQVALVLAGLREKDAVPVLIALLGELPGDKLWQVEDLLRRLAGSQAPDVPLGTDKASERKCREAWAAWWRANSSRINLARLDSTPHLLGYTLITQLEAPGRGGRVLEVGPDRKVRWHIEGLALPMDAQVLPGNRVLIAEYQGGRVTERSFQGDILWEKAVGMPINVQRLADGSTFIATQQQLLQVDRAGKETAVDYHPPGGGFLGGRKLRDGQIACITQGGIF
ncbi:MAG: HEAT repeat domain-containing protein, partial [Planctomycetes bacterium]|nr:HEAT repeat domain-containing protein [Planctomycetota bacterium]